jgi:hypothetical protein
MSIKWRLYSSYKENLIKVVTNLLLDLKVIKLVISYCVILPKA